MEKVMMLKATFGEHIEKLFEEMVKQSQESKSDVFGLFNGVLYVAFRGIKTADEVDRKRYPNVKQKYRFELIEDCNFELMPG